MDSTVVERRKSARQLLRDLKRELNEAQLETLSSIEKFGWELKFVRRKPFQPAVAVVADGDRKSMAVLELDGTLNESHAMDIREE